MNKCWNCKYFEYDEIFDADTGDEWQLPSCLKGNDVDESQCEDFEHE